MLCMSCLRPWRWRQNSHTLANSYKCVSVCPGVPTERLYLLRHVRNSDKSVEDQILKLHSTAHTNQESTDTKTDRQRVGRGSKTLKESRQEPS